MEDLKPCPFCGGEAKLFTKENEYNDAQQSWDIRCVGSDGLDAPCYLYDGADWWADNKEEIIKLWNRRV